MGLKTEKRVHIPQVVMSFTQLLSNRGVRVLFGMCCPVSWSIHTLAEIGEPYQEEGYYITAEEYTHLDGCHESEAENARN